jgi:hypothetical protein
MKMGHLQSSPALSDYFSDSIILLACLSTNNGISKVWGSLLFLASEMIADDAPSIVFARISRRWRGSSIVRVVRVAHG